MRCVVLRCVLEWRGTAPGASLFLVEGGAIVGFVVLALFAGLIASPARGARARLQDVVHSVRAYPFVTAIERAESAAGEFVAEEHGTGWQPHLDKGPRRALRPTP